MIVLSFDTETTAIPDWKNPSDGDDQPHMMSIGAILFDDETGEDAQTLDLIVRPDGWASTQEAFEVHGITHEHALAVGVPEREALEALTAMCLSAVRRTAFNTTFDNRMVRIAQKRYWPKDEWHEELMRSWKEDKHLYVCSMMTTKKHLKLAKNPTLEEAVQLMLGAPLRQAGQPHNAMQDARAAKDLYMALKAVGAI